MKYFRKMLQNMQCFWNTIFLKEILFSCFIWYNYWTPNECQIWQILKYFTKLEHFIKHKPLFSKECSIIVTFSACTTIMLQHKKRTMVIIEKVSDSQLIFLLHSSPLIVNHLPYCRIIKWARLLLILLLWENNIY